MQSTFLIRVQNWSFLPRFCNSWLVFDPFPSFLILNHMILLLLLVFVLVSSRQFSAGCKILFLSFPLPCIFSIGLERIALLYSQIQNEEIHRIHYNRENALSRKVDDSGKNLISMIRTCECLHFEVHHMIRSFLPSFALPAFP